MYIELHTRSAFSFLEGGSLPEELVSACANQSMPAVALLDRDGVYGTPRFHMAAKKAGLRAHIGAEVSVEGAGLQTIAPAWIEMPALPQPVRYSLLVETAEGYRNLCRLITQYKLRKKSKGTGRTTLEELQAHAQGLVCLTGGAEGPLAAALARGGDDAARNEVERLIQIFGPSNVYVELQRHFDRQEEFRNQAAVRIARRLALPLLATNGVRYARPEDRELLDVLTCVRHHCSLETAGRLLESNAERHLRSPSDMARLFADLPGAIANTAELSARLGFTLADLGYEFPKYPVPEGETMMSFLRQRTEEGLRERYLPKRDSGLLKRAQQQIERELCLIEKLHLEGYFLIVWDIVRFCRQEGILVQGRGSAANSAVCYALGITAIDPVGMELLFERFLSEERGEWPDIDLDLPSGDARERAIQYVYQRYGKLGAAMTANVITYRGRSAAREVGKVLGFDPDTLNRLASLIGSWEWKGATDILENQFGQAGFNLEHPRIAKYLELSTRLQDLPRHLGQHSGGMVICQGQLDSVVPLEPASMPGRVVVQWDKDDCADLGIVKVDLLGLGMMAVLKDCLTLVPQHYGAPLDLAQLPQDDPEVYRTLQQADTVGMFQVESRAQMSALPRNRPQRFYDLVVQVAIIRPGPIVGKMMNPYMKRRQGREPVRYAHPSLEPILKRTLGVPLFQEQLLRIAMTAANFTGGEAEELRRAMGHKRSRERMQEIEDKLRRGMEQNNISPEAQEEIIASISSFALYGFPESHAASFALIAYASAYLKCHYLAAFTAALLNNQPMGFYSAATLVKDAQRHGLKVKPVDVLRSEWLCTLEPGNDLPSSSTAMSGGDHLKRFGAPRPNVKEGSCEDIEPQHKTRLPSPQRGRGVGGEGKFHSVASIPSALVSAGLFGLGQASATACTIPSPLHRGEGSASCPILRLGLRYVRGLRKESAEALVRARATGAFSSIEDITLRVPALNKNEWTMLAKVGALNSLETRFHRRDALWQVERAVRPPGALFRQSQPVEAPSPLSPMTDEERLVSDFHGTGLTVGRHPMAHRRPDWDEMHIKRACDLKAIPDGRFTRIAGCVIARQRPGTAKGFLFLSLEDETGIANAIVTPDVYERNRILLTRGRFLMIEGILQNQDNVVSVKARRIHSLSVTAAETESHDFH
ncbi:MAG: DNA polymerase III subunit alpha [Acidimicrobiia bacterium]|nr:DNA polymerase III subunit alpha [Acidimicrobiia bacterium]